MFFLCALCGKNVFQVQTFTQGVSNGAFFIYGIRHPHIFFLVIYILKQIIFNY